MTEPTNEQIERWPGYVEQSWQQRFAELDQQYLDAVTALSRTIAEAEAREAAAEHRAHIAGMREAAGIAEGQKYAEHIVTGRSREGDEGAAIFNEACDDTAQAIRQRATAIETGEG